MSGQRTSPVWHPFTQHALAGDFPVIARSDGVWLETVDGRRILDAISSWWVITHGHRQPRIVAAIKQAAERIDQVIFAGLTHEAAEKVAARLIEIAPPGLSHVFYSDSGSTSVEVALKMALGHWLRRGERRTRILALEHGYHGDTVGAMSAGARGVFNAAYAPLLFEVGHIPFPGAGSEQDCLDALERECRQGDGAALIVEPLVLGAGGMLIYSAGVLSEMASICRRYGVLFIADEVMTGFGRTGTLFACEQAGVTPDIMCIAKGLTGGALPLAATLSTPEIFQSHFSKDRTRTLFHSSSYTANPIACAAALENLEIWRTEPVGDRIAGLTAQHAGALERFRSDDRIEGVRQIGTIAVLDVAVRDSGYLSEVGPRLHDAFMARGILLRPLGNTIYIMPPYCIASSELNSVYEVIDGVL
ncbi:MAG: adenosylmethionine--8-amino-7-oxononanoate transaminase [Hyphomicrobiaceae bacterium]